VNRRHPVGTVGLHGPCRPHGLWRRTAVGGGTLPPCSLHQEQQATGGIAAFRLLPVSPPKRWDVHAAVGAGDPVPLGRGGGGQQLQGSLVGGTTAAATASKGGKSGRRLCLCTAAATACPAHNWLWEVRGAPKVGGVAATTTSVVTVVLPPRFATRNGGASVGVSGDDGTRRRRRGQRLRRSAATQFQMTVCPSGQFPRRGLGVVVWLLLPRGGPVGRYWTRRAVGDSPFRLRGSKLTPPPPAALLPTRATRPLHTPCTKAHQRMMLPGVTRSFAIFQVLST